MALSTSTSSQTLLTDEDESSTAHELQPFDSIWHALQWKHVRARAPICWRKLLRSRYMLANLVYLAYVIGLIAIDFHPYFHNQAVNGSAILTDAHDQPVVTYPRANRTYIVIAVLHLISAFLYWYAWRDRSWLDVIMIPEYLNHLEAVLYLWSAIWYSKEDTLSGYYTLAVHRIELSGALIEFIACCGWIMSWYLTYTRMLGRGFTLDDPDTLAYTTTTTASVIYVVYSIQTIVHPEDYGTNTLYIYADVFYFVGALFYIAAALRDENCFWFLPLAGQYGVAAGRIRVETKTLPQYGKPPIRMTDVCKRRSHQEIHQNLSDELSVR